MKVHALSSRNRRFLGFGLALFGVALIFLNASALEFLFKTPEGLFLTVAVCLGLVLVVWEARGVRVLSRYRRGAFETSFTQAEKRAILLRKQYEEGPFFGMVELPFASKEGHFCVVGATGSGKTVTIRLFLQRIVPELTLGTLQGRALIYDAKQDILPILSTLGGNCAVHILNPFDARSSSWDMAKDITEPATAYQVASLIISDPEKADGNSMFFINTMRNIMSAVIQSLIEFAPTHWTFRDVLLAMATERNLRLVLERTAKGRQVLEACLREGETFGNIRASIEARISEYEIIAALWHSSDIQNRPRFSLSEWLSSRSIAVLGNRESSRKVMDTLNALLLSDLLSSLTMGQK